MAEGLTSMHKASTKLARLQSQQWRVRQRMPVWGQAGLLSDFKASLNYTVNQPVSKKKKNQSPVLPERPREGEEEREGRERRSGGEREEKGEEGEREGGRQRGRERDTHTTATHPTPSVSCLGEDIYLKCTEKCHLPCEYKPHNTSSERVYPISCHAGDF